MVQITINSISVDFPYDPYASQVRYMSHVIDALRSGQNALLESPTGTGKTLCLLCATLAWRSTYVAALQAQAHAKPAPSDSENPQQQQPNVPSKAAVNLFDQAGLRPLPGSATTALLSALVQPQKSQQQQQQAPNDLATPRIVYASRTHSQLTQAIHELKKTTYKPSMSLVASRDQLCIHEISNTYGGSRLNAMCRKITAQPRRKCRYHLSIASPRSYENRSSELVTKLLHEESPSDIEDLKVFGNSQVTCPYYLSRLAAQSDECEILFLPYNYLIDLSTRSSLDINWSNDIIIIDEAHNLESICSDSVSFDLSSTIRSNFDSQLLKLIENGLRPGGISIPALENMIQKTNTHSSDIDKIIGTENKDLLEIRLMRSVMNNLEEFINNADLNRKKDHSDISFAVFPSQHLRKLLQQSGGPTVETYDLYLQMFDRITDMQLESSKLNESSNTDQQHSSSSNAANNAIRMIQTAIRILFESVLSGKEHCFRTVIQYNASKPNAGRTLSHWCFNPSVAMSSISSLNTRCLLLTSGTLSPLDSFASELGLSFPIRLENPHVVTSRQVWAGVIHSGPSLPNEAPSNSRKLHRLTSAYFARGDDSSVDLGRCILFFASIIPDGLLVFYPSYSSLYACTEVWKRLGPGVDRAKPSIWEHLLRHKRIVTEERDSTKVSAAVLAHRANVDASHGSILLAVCRGKVSEGIDFSDEYGRAVFITGLPYPSAMDPKVVLKREYADEEVRKRNQPSNVNSTTVANVDGSHKLKVLNGAQWYTAQALRAVNQAVGRAIRHRFDYGAILLCDERFQSVPLQGQISKWIRPSIKVHPTFQAAQASLKTFFTSAAESDFAKEGDRRRLNAPQRGESSIRTDRSSGMQHSQLQRRNDEQDTNAVVVAQGAIDQLLPPPMTEAQFVDQMVSISDEIKAAENVDLLCELQRRRKQEQRTREVEEKKQSRSQGVKGPKAPGSSKSVLVQLNSENAKGGLLDSGNGASSGVVNNSQQPSTAKRSEMFLASRSQRNESGSQQWRMASSSKRLRRTIDDGSGRVRPSQPEKLSEKIKRVFESANVRPFLELFRQLLAINSKITDGVGPLQSLQELRSTHEMGTQLVDQIVNYTREKARKEAGVPSPKTLLHELRSKIPATFQDQYDEAIKNIS